MNGPRPVEAAPDERFSDHQTDHQTDLTADLSGDVTGDTGDWLRASLDDEPLTELQPSATAARPSAALTSATPASAPSTSGTSKADADADADDSASWERSVIGDEPGSDTDPDPTKQELPTTATRQTGANRPAQPTSAPIQSNRKRGTSTAPPAPAAKSFKPSDRPVSGPHRSAAEKSTWSGRRRARRADKRLAEREAKALMHRRPLWRGRVIPKTVLGITFTMLVSGLAMAVSGTLLYMNYRYRQDQSDALVRNFPQQVRQAQRAVQNEGRNARSLIQDELEPLRKLAATAETLTTVLTTAEPSVWAVRTFDVDGQGTAGTAFVVASDDEKTFMVTSLSVVKASTAKPGPQILVRKGNAESTATLWTWDDKRDLALLVVSGLGNQPPLSWAAPTSTRLGDQVFIMSGFGANDASIVEGRVGDVFADGIQHTAPIGTHFRGGPIIDSQGRVVAVASWDYAPLGFTSQGVFFASPIAASCEQVLRCLNNRVDGAGAQR